MSSIAPCDSVHIGDMALADDIDLLVSHRPGLTELALAKFLFGRMGYQQRVNSTCRHLSGRATLNGMGPAVPATRSPTIQERSTVEAEHARILNEV
jgi:hypothetical protein